MKTYEKFKFKVKNQEVTIIEEKEGVKIILSIEKEGSWIKNIVMPLIHLERQSSYITTDISMITSTDDRFKVLLTNIDQSNKEIRTLIETYPSIYPWIHFRTILKSQNPMKFIQKGPEIVLSFYNIDPSNIIYINQPTRHTPPTDEWKSNDMPASYVWNPKTSIETFFFVNFSEMNWMSPETIERFSIYECSFQSGDRFGLLHRVLLPSPIEIPTDMELVYDYYICQNYRNEPMSKWKAVESLINKCFMLIPATQPFPDMDLSWQSFSEGCIRDLMKEKICWFDQKFPKYHAYVMDKSELDRRRNWDLKNTAETMTILDILPPWILYILLHPNQEQLLHLRKTCQSVLQFTDPDTGYLYNNIKEIGTNNFQIVRPNELSIGDSWYFFEPIARLGFLIKLFPLIKLTHSIKDFSYVFKTMVEKSQEFTEKHNYRISAFYDPLTLTPLEECSPVKKDYLIQMRGEKDANWKFQAKNYACLCIHIYIQVEAYYYFRKDTYLKEAEKSALSLMEISPDELFWEPLEIAYGVAGLSELFRITNNKIYITFARKLICNELRMFYWFNDNSFEWKKKRSNLGLVMACVGIRYPAMKENIESIYPWLIFLKSAVISGLIDLIPKNLLKFFNLIRINSFYFFSDVIPKEFIYPPRLETLCSYIPFEDLEMLETPNHFSKAQEFVQKGKRTGTLGREIYGAGETIWLYLMFEALAKSDNKEILVLNIDLFDFQTILDFPTKNLTFILYNPCDKTLETEIIFPYLKNDISKVDLMIINDKKNSKNSIIKEERLDQKKLVLSLKEDEAFLLRFNG
ncbi:MAG: hypothetical protein ACFFAU_10180 [Candidatus Hodarchaeota archaeon]